MTFSEASKLPIWRNKRLYSYRQDVDRALVVSIDGKELALFFWGDQWVRTSFGEDALTEDETERLLQLLVFV